MNRATTTKQVLRSLCANNSYEELDAIENYKNTNINALEFTGVEDTLFKYIQKFYTSSQLAGAPSIHRLVGLADQDLNPHLSAYIKEVGVEPFHSGANYKSVLAAHLELTLTDELSRTLTVVSQISKDGLKTGVGSNAVIERGIRDALDRAAVEVAKLKRRLDPNQRPLGNREAAHEVTIEYLNKAANPNLAYGLTTGINNIDEETRGAQVKELWILAGSTGHSKSTFLINWVRHLITSAAYNIVYYSLEMRRRQVWNILYCSHSCNPKFGRDPLEYSKIKSGTLTSDETDFYINEIIPDIKNAPGHLEVFNPVGRTTIDDVGMQCEVANRERPIDMLVLDYIGMLASPKGMKLPSKTERVGENILRSKQLATDFDNGTGLVVVSAHHTNRASQKKVKEANGVYDLEAIASTSEAENTADNLFTIYQDQTFRQKREAVITHLKARDSKILDPFNVYLPAEYRFVGELAQVDESRLSTLLDA